MRKAGVIPFYFDESGVIRMMFRTSSDPKYGGSRPQLAKGGVDKGETLLEAAMREGYEEVGLRSDNVKAVRMPLTHRDGRSDLTVFAVEIHTPQNFDPFDYETSAVMWMTMDEFAVKGRRRHLPFVCAAYEQMK